MSRDPMQGVINWFALLMACVVLGSLSLAGLALWGLWHLARYVFGG